MRTIWIAILVGLLLALAGCGAPTPETPPMPTGAPVIPSAPPSQNAELLAKVGHGAIHDLIYTPDGKSILAAFETGLGLMDVGKLEISAFWDLPVAPLHVALLAEREAAVLSSSGEILFVGFDPAKGAFSASPQEALPSGMSQRFDNEAQLQLAASPDGKYLAFSGQTTTRVWNLETRQVVWNETRKLSMSPELSFSSDSHYLLLGDSSGRSYSAVNTLVSLADGKAAWSDKGNSLLLGGKSLVFWPSPDEYRVAPLADPGKGFPTRVSDRYHNGRRFFSSDGMQMAHLDMNGTVTLFGLSEPGPTGSANLFNDTSPNPGLFENPLYISRTGKLLAYKTQLTPQGQVMNYHLLVVDVHGSTPVSELTQPFELAYPLPQVHFAPDGESAVYTQGPRLARVEFASKKITTFTDELTSGVTALRFAPDGKTLAAGAQDFIVTYFDPARNLAEVRSEPLQVSPNTDYSARNGSSRWFRGVTGLAFSTDGKLLAADTSNGALYILTPAGSPPPIEIRLHDSVFDKGGQVEMFGLAISPLNGMPATGGYENAVRVWNNLPIWKATSRIDGGAVNVSHHTGTVQMTFLEDSSVVTSLAYASDGRLAAGTEQGAIRLWRADGTLERSFSGHVGRITGLAWAGETLISASEDGTVRFWQAGDGAQTRLLTFGVPVTGLALDGRSEVLALGMQNGQTWLWEMGTGRWLGHIPGSGVIRTLAFSPDASLLALGSEGGQLQLWQVRLADGKLAEFPAGEPQTFIPACQLSGDVRGFKEGTYLAGSPARLGWELTYSGDCSSLGVADLREVDNATGLNAKSSLTSTYGYPQLPRLLNTLHIQTDVTIPDAPGVYQYAWELKAPDGQTIPISASITVIPASAGVNLPAPVYFVSETQTLLRLETDGRTLTPIIEAPVACLDISPSSGEIAYLSNDALWLTDLNGGNRRVLLPIGGCPSWSTDGKLIGFTLNGVKVVNVASGEIQTLARDLRASGTQMRHYQRVLDWSPFSNKFIASVTGWESYGLKVFDLPTGAESRLTGWLNPSWSLNGENIYTGNPEFSGYDGTPPYLLRTSVLTGEVTALLGNSETDLTGAVAPFETAEGSLLAFVGQASSTDSPPTSLAAARVSLEKPGQFSYDPNPHPVIQPAEVVWWRDGSAALVRLSDNELLATFPFSENPNVYLPLRGSDFRWNRFAPVTAFVPVPTATPAPETASNDPGLSGYRLAYLGGAQGSATELTSMRADGSGQMRPYPSLSLSSPVAKFAWAVDGQSLFALTEAGELYQVRPLDNRFYEYVTPAGLPRYALTGAGGQVKDFSLSPDGRTLAVVYLPTDSGLFNLPEAEQRLGRDNLGLLDLQQKRWVDVNIPAIATSYAGRAAILLSASAWSKDSQRFVVSVTQDPALLEARTMTQDLALISHHSGGSGDEVVSLLVANVSGLARNITLTRPASDDLRSEFHPVWAADGLIYFYSTGENDNPGLYRIDPGGKGQTRLADCEGMDLTNAAFTVSPDGKHIATRALSDDGSYHWAVIATSNDKPTFLPVDSEPVEMPVWSPDGRQLAWFFLDASLTPKIFLMYPADGRVTSLNLPKELTEAHALAWSPDGQALAFRSYLPGNGLRLYLLPMNGSPAQPVASDVLDGGVLVWSPVLPGQP